MYWRKYLYIGRLRDMSFVSIILKMEGQGKKKIRQGSRREETVGGEHSYGMTFF